MSYCPVFETKLVRTGSIRYRSKVNSTQLAIRIASEMLNDSPCERFVTIALDTKLQVIGSSVITVGTLDASLVHPREVFRFAMLSNASAIVIAHNHPSGDTTPSRQDYDVYSRLKKAGELIGISVLDSIVVDGEGRGISMAEEGGSL